MPIRAARASRSPNDRLILGPVGKKDLLAILATREPIKDDDPDVDEMLPPLETDRS